MEVRDQLSNAIKEELLIPSSEECTYTSCYCEENVWMLCEHVRKARPEELIKCHAVFISNSETTIPLWCQQASKDKETGVVVWDYHVIFITGTNGHFQVYDLDTTLPFPCSFQRYARNALKSDASLKPQYHRFFRVIPASQYLRSFASDRSHMRNDVGKWLKPPPSYPCIQTESATNNLSDFVSMDVSETGVGDVLTFDQFLDRFNRQTSMP